MAERKKNWDQRYKDGDTPWDSGIRSRELARILDEEQIPSGRAIELGCGSGTNAVYLAQCGFDVTAVDVSSTAIDKAREKATAADVAIKFIQADVCHFAGGPELFDFVFDRGCFHCARKIDLPGFLATLRTITRPGTKYVSLTGNANEQLEKGPPTLCESEIRADLGELFDFDFIREIRFEDPGGIDGPLGWSCLMTRK